MARAFSQCHLVLPAVERHAERRQVSDLQGEDHPGRSRRPGTRSPQAPPQRSGLGGRQPVSPPAIGGGARRQLLTGPVDHPGQAPISWLLSGRGTISVPAALEPAASFSSPLATAAATRPTRASPLISFRITRFR
jgi:hypothetical protein